MSDDRPTGEPEPPTNPVPRIPEQPAAPAEQPTAPAEPAEQPAAPAADAEQPAVPADQPTTPLPPLADQPTEPFSAAAAPVPPPVPPAGYVPPAPPTGQAGAAAQQTAPGAGWAEVWSPGQTPEWHDAQFTGGVATAPSRKGLALSALIVGIAAVVFSLLGFVPLVGFAFLGLGGLLGVVALILGIIALSTKNRDGRGMGLTGVILGAIGVLLAIAAIVAQVLFIAAIANTGSRTASGSTSEVAPSVSPPATGTMPSPQDSPTASGNYDEQAYLDQVKPQLLALLKTISPSLTELPWSDDYLVTMGKSIESLGTDSASRDAARETVASMVAKASNGTISKQEANKFFDIIADAADAHLAE